jgi:transcriptional regulator with XRE-family HTH domain
MKKDPTIQPQPKVKLKPGPKPMTVPVDRPKLIAEWQHLRSWWDINGKLYSVKQIAEIVKEDPATVSRLLNGTGRSAPTAERLDALVAVLSRGYTKPS